MTSTDKQIAAVEAGWKISLVFRPQHDDGYHVRSITKTVLLASVLATAHVTGVLPVSSSVQAAEAASQETVNLTISGMT